MTTSVRFVLSYDFKSRILMPSKWICFQIKITLLLRTSPMTLRIPAKVNRHVVIIISNNFYCMKTGKQRRHMINHVLSRKYPRHEDEVGTDAVS